MERLEDKKTIYAIVGPTCTYKSRLAIDLALKYPFFEIVSADSRLVYKEMNIGTSKPSFEDRKKVLHHMIDLVEPDFDYSVGLYKKEVEELLQKIISRGTVPLFVGGTGLYLNSVLVGLDIPGIKADLSLRRQLKEIPQEELYSRLEKLDQEATKIIHKNDNFRTIRALEVIYKTNKSFSELKKIKDLPFSVIWLGVAYKDRDLYVEKINERTKTFVNNGFLDEVKFLLSEYGELNLFKNTIGYKEAIDFLKNRINKSDMIEKITLATKQFVKRQMTWFRANKNIKWLYLDDLAYNDALSIVCKFIQEESFANTSKVSISWFVSLKKYPALAIMAALSVQYFKSGIYIWAGSWELRAESWEVGAECWVLSAFWITS